jgi:hypothetical protein
MSELIPTGYTYDQGRIALNDSFSATGYFNNIEASANITGTTYYSGATPLELIIQNLAIAGSVTHVQNGTNSFTGGTPTNPTVNISAATLTYLSATTISGGTLYSGSTDLYDIFCTDCGGTGSTGFSGFSSSTGTFSIIENNGSGNLASDSYGVAGGNGAISDNYGERSWSNSGTYGQCGFLAWYGDTTLAPSNVAQIYLDGSSSQFVVPLDSSYYVDFTITARIIGGSDDGDSGAWTTEGLVKNVGGTVSVVADPFGNFFPITLKSTDGSFPIPITPGEPVDIVVSAETATSALTVTVIGPDDNVDWYVQAYYTKVK